MSIFVGSDEVIDAKVGSTDVQEIYVGSDLVWGRVYDINYAPDQWTSGAAGTLWTLSDTLGGGWATFRTTSVELESGGYFTGSSVVKITSNMQTDSTSITVNPSSDYTLNFNVSSYSANVGGGLTPTVYFYNSTGGLITNTGGATVSSTGLKTFAFTTPSTAATVKVRILCAAESPVSISTQIDSFISSVYLERV